MSALAAWESESGDATLAADVPERLNLLDASRLISRRLVEARLKAEHPKWDADQLREAVDADIEENGYQIAYSRLRQMWAKDHPAILWMKRAKEVEKVHGDWRIPIRAVIRAADNWPRDWRGPDPLPQEVQDRILELRESGLTFQAIADRLQELGIPTRSGHDQWRAATVHWVVTRAQKERGEA